jgi:HK97 family phage major capsid protein
MRTQTYTTLPFLVALFIGLTLSPLSVVRVDARQLGTLDAGHLLGKTSALVQPTRSAAPSLLERLRLVFGDEKGEVAAELLVPVAGLKACKQRASDLVNALKAVQAKLGTKLSDEDRVAAKADLDKLLALADENRENLQTAERIAGMEAALTPAADPDDVAGRRAATRAGVTEVKERFEDDPKRGFKDHRDQLTHILRAGQTGQVDNRLKALRYVDAAGGDEAGGHTDPHGGFLLAPAFQPDILSVQAEADPIGGLVRRVPMSASRVSFNARTDKNHTTSVTGGLVVSRTPETQAAATSRMEFEQVELVAHDLCGVGHATNRILRESPASFLALLQSGFRDEFAAKLLDERLNGTGAAEFAGVISDDATISVAKETGQAADTILFENVNKMRARCWRYGRAVWLANHDTIPQVTTLYMPIGTGGERVPIYMPGDEAAPEGRLLGRPIYFTEFTRTVGDKGDIVLGVWSEYLEGDLGGMEEASSVHVRFLNREQTFLFVVANDAKPWWRSTLTPKYSTQTLSPFVVLAARA